MELDPAALHAHWFTGDLRNQDAIDMFDALPTCVGCGGRMAPWSEHRCGWGWCSQEGARMMAEKSLGVEKVQAMLAAPALSIWREWAAWRSGLDNDDARRYVARCAEEAEAARLAR